MVIIIYLGILLINIVAVFMVYKFLGTDMEKKEKLIFLFYKEIIYNKSCTCGNLKISYCYLEICRSTKLCLVVC